MFSLGWNWDPVKNFTASMAYKLRDLQRLPRALRPAGVQPGPPPQHMKFLSQLNSMLRALGHTCSSRQRLVTSR